MKQLSCYLKVCLLPVQWVVSPADKAKYDELFSKTDGDMDGLVSGPEVRDIFLKTGLPSATLARIWLVRWENSTSAPLPAYKDGSVKCTHTRCSYFC